ncbi:ATP-binding cassette domain-containing protein [Kosakonia quasisacchari]|uniref:ATP-binding cassette domain-containing protein n=1 Tax=Kosakonia quasisacchari TaxID=2529380 RepID=A0A4R0H7M5_9ENTR|nr:ATP-binding cassette domain-containing protein [Kosakonia quasisacchari]TCC04890.1 ATP-binding cassette domain-containing protein [Kosakonia quasisacchari]
MKKKYHSSPEMVYQGEISECGLSCVCMMLNTLGENTTLADLRDKWGGGNGASIDLLVRILKSYGYEALPVKFDVSSIQYLPVPCILHYGGNHYVYVYSHHGAFFQVLNPATGRLMISAEELELSATGFGLILDESLYNDKKSSGKIRSEKGWLEKLSFPGIMKRCFLAIFLSLFSLITPMLFSFISKDQNFFVDEQINIMFMGMIMLFCLISFLQYISNKYGLNAAINAATKYKPSLFKRLLKKDISYFERRSSADINQRINSIGMVVLNREKILNDKYKALTITVVTLCIMLWLNVVLSILSIGTMAIFGCISYYFAGIKKSFSKSLEESVSDVETFNLETINGIQAIRSGELSTGILGRYNALLEVLFHRYKKVSSTDIRQSAIFSFLSNIDSILFLWISFYSISELHISYGNVIAFWFFRKIAMDSINQFYQCCVAQKLQNVSDERLKDMLSYKEIDITRQHSTIKESVCVQNLQFGYGPDSSIIKNLTIEILLHSRTAVIGTSGAGKSTLLKLLSGLYKPGNGNFIIDGHEINKDDLHLFYSNMYYLPQGSIVFNGTIYDNIVWYSGGEANERDCRAMLTKFGLLEVITSLPAGLYTKISPSNPVLSSGQLQRLMLCRALLSSKSIILLDEPTANLDEKSAMLALDSLMTSDKTIILSTHDVKTLSLFDNVIDLDNY